MWAVKIVSGVEVDKLNVWGASDKSVGQRGYEWLAVAARLRT